MRGEPGFFQFSMLAPLLLMQKDGLLFFSEFLERFDFLIGANQRFTATGQLFIDDFPVTVNQPDFTDHVPGVITPRCRAVDVDFSSFAELTKFVKLVDPLLLQRLAIEL